MAAHDQPHDVAIPIRHRFFQHRRHVRQLLAALRGHDEKHVQTIGPADPVGTRGLDGAPGPAAAAIKFAALDGERHVVAAGIAGDDAKTRAKQAPDHHRIGIGIRPRALAADRRIPAHRIIPGLYLRLLRHRADAELIGGGTDPGELARVILHFRRADERLHGNTASEGAEDRAVLGSSVEEIIGGGDASRARHVLHDDLRRAGHMLAHVPGDGARIDVVAATRAVADDHRHRLAPIKIGDLIRPRRQGGCTERRGESKDR